jgi:hypothetical protein
MRDGRAPRGFAAASIKTRGLPGGTEERFAGYGVMGLPFRSGHYLALRHFPASSIGPGYRAVWHRDPHRRWTFYADAPAEVSCARYFGATSPGGAERVPIDVTWTRPRSLRVTVPDVLTWEVHLVATAATRLLSSASRLLPDPRWDSDRVLGAMGRVAGLLLRAGRVRLQGTVPNGQHFQAAPRLVWAVTNSTALVGGHDIGPPGPLPHQDRLGDFWLPQRGLFTVGTVRFDTCDPTRHHPATNRLTGHEMSTKAMISIAEIPGTLRAGTPVRLAGAR